MKSRAQNLFVALLIALGTTVSFAYAQTSGLVNSSSNQVTLKTGAIEGLVLENGMRVFKGIPFAEPPVGPLRWKAPQPVKPWPDVKSAKEFGPAPIQDQLLPALIGVPKNHSEDCLYLNVWTPAKTATEKLPVMVWIHGGAFSMGSTSQPLYDGSRLAEKGVVVVSIGYRLGPFGFLAHPELTREGGGGSGNYGLRDLIAGLEWVRDNIATFGGDPNCVTIFGESAGGGAVNILASSPRAKGLFHRAICESGPGFTPPRDRASEPFHMSPTLKVAEQEGEAFIAKLNVKNIADARALPADAVLAGGLAATATFDGDILPGDQVELFESGKFNDTPILVGSNSNDGAMFVLTPVSAAELVEKCQGFGNCADKLLAVYPHATNAEASRSAKDAVADIIFRWPAWTWAKLESTKGKHKAFLYYFDQPKSGAGHAAEIAYVFGRPPESGVIFKVTKREDTKLSELMSEYWVNFAKTGDPNGPGLPEWTAFAADGSKAMTFDTEPGMKSLPHPERLEVLDAYMTWRRQQAK
jgi:para-nitrobenzyl esterase